MTESFRESPEFLANLDQLNMVEDYIIGTFTTVQKSQRAQVLALQYARYSLAYAKFFPNPPIGSYEHDEITRWTTAIIPLKENNWREMKNALLTRSASWKPADASEDDEELKSSREAFLNLALSLPES